MTTTTTNEGALPAGSILLGDARARLRHLPSRSIDTVITSPPYYRLRDYGVDGQLGLEEAVGDWVAGLLEVLGQVERVLKPTGVVWLNLGDTYSRDTKQGAAVKSLLLGPERLLLALAEAGWSVRNKVVWHKANPMPTSVRDRLSSAWEPLYLLTRSRHYFFDLDAIRVPPRSKLARPSQARSTTKYHATPGQRPEWSGPGAGSNTGLDAIKAEGRKSHVLGKNPGDVWTMATAAYRGAHFATFPEGLIERPLLATCPERVCASCGTPWRRAPHPQAIGHVALMSALRKSCACSSRDWRPGVVLDPFIGSGTVAVIAERLHRRWVGIELKDEYRRLALRRIAASRNETKGGSHGTTTSVAA
jgi:DNA modification methylase